MKANELRIGNITNFGKVTDIHANHFYTEDEDGISYKSAWADIKALPLDKDWLIRLGFSETPSTYEMAETTDYTSHGAYIDMADQRISFRGNGSADYSRIEYVHQLQNLYFALTGSELEVKAER